MLVNFLNSMFSTTRSTTCLLIKGVTKDKTDKRNTSEIDNRYQGQNFLVKIRIRKIEVMSCEETFVTLVNKP